MLWRTLTGFSCNARLSAAEHEGGKKAGSISWVKGVPAKHHTHVGIMWQRSARSEPMIPMWREERSCGQCQEENWEDTKGLEWRGGKSTKSDAAVTKRPVMKGGRQKFCRRGKRSTKWLPVIMKVWKQTFVLWWNKKKKKLLLFNLLFLFWTCAFQ